MPASDPFTRILRAVLMVLGVWAIYAQISVLIGNTFNELLAGAWIPALVIVLLAFGVRSVSQAGSSIESIEQRNDTGTYSVSILALVALGGILFLRPGNFFSAALYASVVLILLIQMGDRVTSTTIPNEYISTRAQKIVVLVVMLASMTVALCEHRVNWDDAKYLHIVANSLEHPDQAMLVYDNLHGVEGLKIYHPSVQLQTYELLVAAISKVSSINYLYLYYLILPPIWAALAVVAQWVLIRRFAGKNAPLALIATFLLLAVWGGHRSYGAFAFDFVGRGIFLTFGVPALIAAVLDFAEMRNPTTWLFLFLATWTGCLFTSTAYAVAPVAVVLVLIACYSISSGSVPVVGAGLFAVIWCPVLLAYVTWVDPIVTPIDVDTPGNVHTVFKGAQGRIALILFGLAPFLALLAKLKSAKWLLRYAALCFIILLSGFPLNWIGKYSSILSWRILWAIPVPVIIGVGLSALIAILHQRLISRVMLRNLVSGIVLLIVTLAFSIAGNTVVSRNFGWPALKMDQSVLPVVRGLVQCSKPTDSVLAPPQIAVPVAGFIGAPSLVAVRGHHLSYLSVQWGNEETERRKRLFNIVQGKLNSPEDIVWAQNELLKGTINRVVLKKNNEEAEPIKNMMRLTNMDHVSLKNWEVWLPNTSEQESLQIRACIQAL